MSFFNSSQCLRVLRYRAVAIGVFVGLALDVHAVELILVQTNVTMSSGRTFQVPISASDPDGQPLKFAVTVNKKSAMTAVYSPRTNRSLLLDVSGVDATNGPFTGEIVLQLFEDLTPLTTARIIDLVNSNFYNGVTFHRVIQNFVAQGGDPTGTGAGGSGVALDDEFVKTLTFTGFGQLAMANSGDDSNDSQFFITDDDLSLDDPMRLPPQHLNFNHTIFGQITRGFDVLAKIMETPVASSNNKPLSNVVINAATVITNSQDAVLRLTAAPSFLGTVLVTVSATNAENLFASQTLQVNVITNSGTSAPFLGPIPSSITTTQNTAATFILTTTDIDGRPTSLAVEDTDTGGFPSYLYILGDPRTGRLWFNPDMTLTGTVHLVIGVTDDIYIRIHQYDTQRFSLTFVPWSATPTMTIVPLKGMMQDTAKVEGDRVKVTGPFAFNDQSDHTFTSNDVLVLTVGDPVTPFTVRVTPGNSGWKVRNGRARAKAHVISGVFSNVAVSAQFSLLKSSFSMSIRGFDFPASLTNQIQIGVALGNDYTTDVRPWVETKPGIFRPPAVP